MAPAQMEFVLGSWGGLSQDLQRATDMIYGVVRDKKIGGESISETPFGSVTRIPLLRRFAREATEYGAPKAEAERKEKEEIVRNVTTERIMLEDRAKEIWETMEAMETKEERQNYLYGLGDELTPGLKEELKVIKEGRNTWQALSPHDPVEVRARYIAQKIRQWKEDGVSNENIKRMLREAQYKKVLTNAVIKRIKVIQSLE